MFPIYTYRLLKKIHRDPGTLAIPKGGEALQNDQESGNMSCKLKAIVVLLRIISDFISFRNYDIYIYIYIYTVDIYKVCWYYRIPTLVTTLLFLASFYSFFSIV